MSIIFGPDPFDVIVDTNIDAYPVVTPDYAYSRGTGTNILVNAANDRAQANVNDTDLVARCINAAVSSSLGDQEARGDCTVASSNSQVAGLAVRYSSTTRGYFGLVDPASASEVQIWEDNAGVTMIASADRGLGNGTHAVAVKVTGPSNNATITNTAGGTAVLSFNDTTAPATGSPGLYLYHFSSGTAAVDNFLVDDLAVAGGAPFPPWPSRTFVSATSSPIQGPWTAFACAILGNARGWAYPAIEDVRNGHLGSFPCAWTIPSFLNPRRMVVGVCRPNPAQRESIRSHPLVTMSREGAASMAKDHGLLVPDLQDTSTQALIHNLSQQLRHGRTIFHLLRELRVNFPETSNLIAAAA